MQYELINEANVKTPADAKEVPVTPETVTVIMLLEIKQLRDVKPDTAAQV